MRTIPTVLTTVPPAAKISARVGAVRFILTSKAPAFISARMTAQALPRQVLLRLTPCPMRSTPMPKAQHCPSLMRLPHQSCFVKRSARSLGLIKRTKGFPAPTTISPGQLMVCPTKQTRRPAAFFAMPLCAVMATAADTICSLPPALCLAASAVRLIPRYIAETALPPILTAGWVFTPAARTSSWQTVMPSGCARNRFPRVTTASPAGTKKAAARQASAASTQRTRTRCILTRTTVPE